MTILLERTETSPQRGRLASLTAESLGQFELAVPDDVPAFLLAANEALQKDLRSLARAHLEEGREQVETLVSLDAERTDVMFIVAKLWYDLEALDEAEVWFQRILQVEPHPHVYYLLSDVLLRQPPRLRQAAHYAQLAHEALPAYTAYHLHWAGALVRSGAITRGLAEFGRVPIPFAEWPGDIQRVYLWHAQYSEALSSEQINWGYRQWADRFAPITLAAGHHANRPDPDRRLRVGYISADFRCHSAASAPKLLLEGHDRAQVEVFGYGNVAFPDATTESLTAKFDRYHDIHGRDARAVAALIEADQIDILVELAGHVTGNRLDVLAYKPAPIQVDFGGISTSGMPQVDYRITDILYDPPESRSQYMERCLYLPHGSTAFSPPTESPAVASLPALDHGYLTLGVFNRYPKVSPWVLGLWARILRDMPTARLLLKFSTSEDETLWESVSRAFEAEGVSRTRLGFVGPLPYLEHLTRLGRVDLLLDTYPCNGVLTTCEGLWMGVPTVTLVGDRFVGRSGLSILTHTGLASFVARSPEAYVQKVIAWGENLQALASIRKSLRSKVLASGMCSPRGLANELEKLYRQMWRRWCETQHGSQVSRTDGHAPNDD